MKGSDPVDRIAGEIRERILSGDIPLGGALAQDSLAAQFGVSRTPVREALRQLIDSGLIEYTRNRGSFVRVPLPWEVREVYAVRAELEALAARLAVARVNDDDLAELRRINGGMRHDVTGDVPGDMPQQKHRGNERFHELIAERAENSHLDHLIVQHHRKFPRNTLVLQLEADPRYREENWTQHESIVDALAARDAEKVGDLMRTHVLVAGERLARTYERTPHG